MISFGYEFFQIIIFIIFSFLQCLIRDPPKTKILPTQLLNQLLILLLFNDLTNIYLLLQQQQNQIKALSKAAMHKQEVKKKSF